MSGYYDIYVLARDRSTATALRFLDDFAPRRQQSAVDYHFPEYSDQPAIVLITAEDAIWHCVDHPLESQSFYFHNLSHGPAHVMLFFTKDRGLILGLSVEEDEADDYFERLREHAGSQIGYVTSEEPPPDTAAEFGRLALTRS